MLTPTHTQHLLQTAAALLYGDCSNTRRCWRLCTSDATQVMASKQPQALWRLWLIRVMIHCGFYKHFPLVQHFSQEQAFHHRRCYKTPGSSVAAEEMCLETLHADQPLEY